MRIFPRLLLVLALLLPLLAACGAEPTPTLPPPTPVPPTQVAAAPTETPIPPTDTPLSRAGRPCSDIEPVPSPRVAVADRVPQEVH